VINSPFPTGDVIARLKAKVDLLRDVGNAADLDSVLESQPAAVPAAYVLGAERGNTPAGASGGLMIQACKAAIQVVLFVRNFSKSDSGGGARSEMDALSRLVDAALINWTPVPGIYKPLWFTSGRDEKFKAGTLVHQRVYSSEFHNRADPNP
jgi:hypothetical protein